MEKRLVCNIMENTIQEEMFEFVPVTSNNQDLLQKIRIERNARLVACDWTQLPDVSLTLGKKQEWEVYRQSLRDFPENCDPTNPVWPTKPDN